MVWVYVVYDISDDGRRLRAARMLERMGLRRIQRSAFVGNLPYSRIRDLSRALEAIIDPGEDVVHLIPVGLQEWKRVIVLGTPLWAAGAPGHYVLSY